MTKNWPFAHFLPTFIFKSGQAETVAPQGFAGFLATFPLFSLHLNAKKILKFIYKWKKKVANWPAATISASKCRSRL